jgi:hypothetical protein
VLPWLLRLLSFEWMVPASTNNNNNNDNDNNDNDNEFALGLEENFEKFQRGTCSSSSLFPILCPPL